MFFRAATIAPAPIGAEHGADLHFKAQLTFDEAWRGFEWPISVTRQEACRSCAGSGYHRSVESRCLACEGTGVVRSVRGHMVFTEELPALRRHRTIAAAGV